MSPVALTVQAKEHQPEVMGQPVGVGLLGCSDIARRRFLPALKHATRANLTAVASREPARAASFFPGERYEVLSAAALLSSPEVEVVYISLPNHLHEEWTVRALMQGKHVICEKPLGLSPGSVERMVALAEERRLVLYENLMFLHHPQHAVVKDLVSHGRIGHIKALRAFFGFPMPGPGNFRMDPAQGGGACHDLIRYPLGIALHLLRGELEPFQYISEDEGELNIALHGQTKSGEGELFSFSIAFGRQYESFYEVVGDQGKIVLDRAFTTPPELANNVKLLTAKGEESILVPPSDHFRLMIDHVAGLVRQGASLEQLNRRTRTLARLAGQFQKGCCDV